MFNIQLVSGSAYPIGYQISPDQRQIFLNSAPNSLPPTVFLLSDRPNYLQQLGGLYLGQTYYPQVQVGGQSYYLQVTSLPNVYDLVGTINDPSQLFGFTLLNPTLNWQTQDRLENIQFINFSPSLAGTQTTGYSFVANPARSGRLTYSPVLCPGDCQTCGGVCPDLFNCVSGQCIGQVPSFGLRGRDSGQEYIYTYKIMAMGMGQALVLTATNPQYISAGVETNDIVRERYFYTDYEGGDQQFVVGKTYPLYTFVNGQKRYLSTPVQRAPSGPTIYSLTPAPVQDTARFTPTQPTVWGQYTLTPANFPGLAYNRPQSLAMWQSSTLMGQPAVVATSPRQTAVNQLFANGNQTGIGQLPLGGQIGANQLFANTNQTGIGQLPISGQIGANQLFANTNQSGIGQLPISGQIGANQLFANGNQTGAGLLAALQTQNGSLQGMNGALQTLMQSPVGAPENPPPMTAQRSPINGACVVDTDCDGWGQNAGQTSCCSGRCQRLLTDQTSMSAVCPELCRGYPTYMPGTCTGNQVVNQPFLLGAALGAGATGATGATAPKSIWQQWWFWVIVGVIILLIIVIIIVLAVPKGGPKPPQRAIVMSPVASTLPTGVGTERSSVGLLPVAPTLPTGVGVVALPTV